MKRLFILFFLISHLQSKADWELFPLNQKSYYEFNDPFWQRTSINSVCMDTIVDRNSYQANFFNRKYDGQYRGCYESIVNVNQPNPIYSSIIEMDSLVENEDTVWYSSNLYFLPHAAQGQSWPFNSYVLTCSNLGVRQFLGITDSIKEFTGISNYIVILSKHHGFLNYIPFYKVNQFSLTIHNLIGFSDSSGSYGFLKPTYLDFMPYHVGDILNWETHSEPPFQQWTIAYQLDSITSISFGPDTIIYSYDSHWIDINGTYYSAQNYIEKFHTADLYRMLESPTNWLSFNAFLSFPNSILCSESYVLETDSSISYRLTNDGFSVEDTFSCSISQVVDEAEHYTYNTSQGFIEYRYDAFYPYYKILVGSKINGVIRGNINLPTAVNELNSQNNFKIFTDPINGKIFINSVYTISNISFIDLTGRILFNDKLNSTQASIDITTLHSSIYFVKITFKDGSVACRQFFKI